MHHTPHPMRRAVTRSSAGLASAALVLGALACQGAASAAEPHAFPVALDFVPRDLAAAGDDVFAVGTEYDGDEPGSGRLALVGTDRVVDLGDFTDADSVAAAPDGKTVYVLGTAAESADPDSATTTTMWTVDTTTWVASAHSGFGDESWIAGIERDPRTGGPVLFGSDGGNPSIWSGWSGTAFGTQSSMDSDGSFYNLEITPDPASDGVLYTATGQLDGELGASTPALWRTAGEGMNIVDLGTDVDEISALTVDPTSGTVYLGTRVDNPGAGEDEPETLPALSVVTGAAVTHLELDSQPWSLALSADGDTLYAPIGNGISALDTDALGSYDEEHPPRSTYVDAWTSSLVLGADGSVYAADQEGKRVLAIGTPSAPTGLRANVDFANRLEVSWTASTNTGGIAREDLSYTVIAQDRAGGAPLRSANWVTTEVLGGFLEMTLVPGHTYDVSVLATNGAFTSAPATVPVTVLVPVASPAAIAVVGGMKVGTRLSVKNVRGAWAPGTKLDYHWVLNESSTGSTAPTFTLTKAHLGKTVSVSVTGTKAGFASTSVWTVPVKVGPGTLSKATPKISGKAKVGQKLSVKPGSWTAGTTLKFQWAANGKAIKGATAKTLKLKAAQSGKQITVKVTGSSAGYQSATAVSAKTAKVKAVKKRRK